MNLMKLQWTKKNRIITRTRDFNRRVNEQFTAMKVESPPTIEPELRKIIRYYNNFSQDLGRKF